MIFDACGDIYALSLAALNRYSDTAVVGAEAINCFTALIGHCPDDDFEDTFLRGHLEHRNSWIPSVRQVAEGTPCVPICNDQDPDSVDGEALVPMR